MQSMSIIMYMLPFAYVLSYHSPNIWLKILSNVISLSFSRYFCMTLRTLRKRNEWLCVIIIIIVMWEKDPCGETFSWWSCRRVATSTTTPRQTTTPSKETRFARLLVTYALTNCLCANCGIADGACVTGVDDGVNNAHQSLSPISRHH